ncbi:hypothetical protein TrVE_jg11692, partial [Triparma verrucosa]
TEDDSEPLPATLNSTNLTGTPLRFKQLPSTSTSTTNSTVLASTPLKGAATRVAVENSPTSPSFPQFDEAAFLPPSVSASTSAPTSINSPAVPRRSAFTSTPLKPTPARVTKTVDEEGEEVEVVVANPPATPKSARKPLKVTGNSVVKPHTPKPSTPKNALLHLLNTGTESDLTILPGVGPKRATQIVKSRSSSPFTTATDLTRAGMTQKQVVKILAFRFEGQTQPTENEENTQNENKRTSRRRSVRA